MPSTVTAIAPLLPTEGPAAPRPGDGPVDGRPGAEGATVPLRDRLVGAGVVLALLLVLGTTALWRVLDDDAVGTPESATAPGAAAPGQGPGTTDDPDVWPVELQPLVEFVERERGGRFVGPVPVEYLDEAAYRDAIAEETSDTTPEDTADLEVWEAQLRALGLVDPGTDLDAALDQLYGEGTLAFYDDDEEVVRVLGTNLDVARQVTLVHELTHVWQDQHGFLDELDELDDTAAYVLQTLAEGDASRIETRFVDQLSSSERDDYVAQSNEQAGGVDLDGVPPVLLAAFASPYVVGEQFVSLLDELGGNEEVDAAFAARPAAEADLLLPTRYLDGDRPIEVEEPSVPDGAERLDGGDFGAVSWLLTLSERIDPREALDLTDLWGGDAAVVYREGERVCTAVAYQGRTPEGTRSGLASIEQWAAASPRLGATGELVGDSAVLRSCEPTGGEPLAAGRSQVALEYPATRLEAAVEALVEGYDLFGALCFGDALVRLVPYEDMAAGVLYDPVESGPLVDAAIEECLG